MAGLSAVGGPTATDSAAPSASVAALVAFVVRERPQSVLGKILRSPAFIVYPSGVVPTARQELVPVCHCTVF